MFFGELKVSVWGYFLFSTSKCIEFNIFFFKKIKFITICMAKNLPLKLVTLAECIFSSIISIHGVVFVFKLKDFTFLQIYLYFTGKIEKITTFI